MSKLSCRVKGEDGVNESETKWLTTSQKALPVTIRDTLCSNINWLSLVRLVSFGIILLL